MSIAYIAIGSNLGDRLKNCETAVERLIQDGVTKKVIKSKWCETEALIPPSPPFSKGGRGGIWHTAYDDNRHRPADLTLFNRFFSFSA